MKLKISTIYIAVLLLVIFLPCLLHAQAPGIGNDDVDDTPIDGGLSLLVAAGVGYGAKKLRKRRTSQGNPDKA